MTYGIISWGFKNESRFIYQQKLLLFRSLWGKKEEQKLPDVDQLSCLIPGQYYRVTGISCLKLSEADGSYDCSTVLEVWAL